MNILNWLLCKRFSSSLKHLKYNKSLEGGYVTLKEGLVLAKKTGMIISADPTYRKGLWNYGKNAKDGLADLLNYSTIFIGGINELK